MKNADMPAMPVRLTSYTQHVAHTDEYGGLTKREMFAMAAMQGFCAHSGYNRNQADLAKLSVMHADALLAELEQTA